MVDIKVVRTYNEILDEEETQIIFVKNSITYFGALFWKEEYVIGTKVLDELKSITIDVASNEKLEIERVIEAYLTLCKKFNLKYFKCTEKTMKHWQYVNEFSNIIF